MNYKTIVSKLTKIDFATKIIFPPEKALLNNKLFCDKMKNSQTRYIYFFMASHFIIKDANQNGLLEPFPIFITRYKIFGV